jgi:hypothetical protein
MTNQIMALITLMLTIFILVPGYHRSLSLSSLITINLERLASEGRGN